MTIKAENDAGADLQPQGAPPGPDEGEPTGDATSVASDHGSGPAADPRYVIPDWSWLPAVRGYLGRIGATARGMNTLSGHWMKDLQQRLTARLVANA